MSDVAQPPEIAVVEKVFGNYLDPLRVPAELPHQAIVEISLPEYARAGIGRALVKVIRFRLTDRDVQFCEAVSLCAASSRSLIVYEDMTPIVAGANHAQAQSGAPRELIAALYARGLPVELITLAALRHAEYPTFEALLGFVETYRVRSAWLESHPLDVALSNIVTRAGGVMPFQWDESLSIAEETPT